MTQFTGHTNSLMGHHLSDAELNRFFDSDAPVDDSHRIRALLRQQLDPQSGWPKLIANSETYRQGLITTVRVEGIELRLVCNQTRAPSLQASTFEGKPSALTTRCFLCELEPLQRGVLIQGDRYIALVNPGITLPGDLTIAATTHRRQVIAGSFSDMLAITRTLSAYSIYFNGALSGASSPHFHFQAGLKDQLPGEIQLFQLLSGMNWPAVQIDPLYQTPDLGVLTVSGFLRTVHLVRAADPARLVDFFNWYAEQLAIVDQAIRQMPNIPDFGSWIDSLGQPESEGRMNICLRYEPNDRTYLAALFSKRFNRPSCYYRSPAEQIILGMAIKEALGHVITCRKQDFERLQQHPEWIAEAYRDTSITPSMLADLNDRLSRFH